MGLITLPYSLTAHTDAKAAEVMADLNKLLTLVNGNIDATNLAVGAVVASSIANGSIEKKHMSAGYTRRITTGFKSVEIGAGSQLSAGFNIAHGLGEEPSAFHSSFITAGNFAIVFENRVITKDAGNVSCQVVASSPMPGLAGVIILWTAVGQP